MKWSEALIPTLKENPSDAEVISHKLMVRAGLVRKLIAGAYSYLPLGVKVLNKVEGIIRQEMNKKGAQEVLLPAIHPPELWKKTGRYDLIGEDMIKFKDRHGREMVLGPTHEEIITNLIASEIRSYRQLPLTLYQIQTKFRDEPRPRFGVIRSCEFIMKDAYSFDANLEGLEKSYKKMYDAYCRIFEHCGLNYIPVEADPGFMGGNVSHEFMVPASSGEDVIVTCDSCKYAASVAVAKCFEPGTKNPGPKTLASIKEVSTPGVSTVEKVSQLLKVKPSELVKTLIYVADGTGLAVLVRGDFDINETKLKNILKAEILTLADEKTIEKLTGGPLGYSGPVNLKGIKIIADSSVKGMNNFVTGANKKDKHLINVNLQRDFKADEWADLRFITESDTCPKCKGSIKIGHAIEVGHTFKLGTKYTKALGAMYLDKEGKDREIIMGCYGIGVNRIIASCIEQNNDKDGIVWPLSISPYEIVVIPINILDDKLKTVSEKIYKDLTDAGYDVLFDDRDERAGIKFKDIDLIGIPLRIVISEKNLKDGNVEIKFRNTQKTHFISEKEIIKEVKKFL